MLNTLIFRPTMSSGVLYAREIGSTEPMQPVGGVQELVLNFDEQKINQQQFSAPGGGNRATVNRVNEATITAKLQDINPVNLARALRGLRSEVLAGTVAGELHTAQAGGLVLLEHVNPTATVVRNATSSAPIAAGGNYEVRPEGIFWFDDSPELASAKAAFAIANPGAEFVGLGIEVDYAHSGYDVVEVLTRSAPVLELYFASVNEAMQGLGSGLHFYRVQQSLTSGLNLISAGEFAALDIEGEVLQDPTKTGAGRSKYMRFRNDIPA